MKRGMIVKFTFVAAGVIAAWIAAGCGNSDRQSQSDAISAGASGRPSSRIAATVPASASASVSQPFSAPVGSLDAMPENQRRRIIAGYIDELQDVIDAYNEAGLDGDGRSPQTWGKPDFNDSTADDAEGVRQFPPICKHEAYLKLREAGMAALPQLIEAIRNDDNRISSVLSLHHVAGLLIGDVLGTNFVDRIVNKYYADQEDGEDVGELCIADIYQNFYDKYGRYGKPECYFRLMLDVKADIRDRSAAAEATYYDILYKNGDVLLAQALPYFSEVYAKMDLPSKPPTLAMAILSLADDELKITGRKSSDSYESDLVLFGYDEVLGLTGKDDPQFKAEVVRRFAAATQIIPQMFYAAINYELGNKSPVDQLCTQLTAGKLPDIQIAPDKKNRRQACEKLAEFAGWLMEYDDPNCVQALQAAFGGKHPYNEMMKEIVRDIYFALGTKKSFFGFGANSIFFGNGDENDGEGDKDESQENISSGFWEMNLPARSMRRFFFHSPYFLSILAEDLSDETSTGWMATSDPKNEGAVILDEVRLFATAKPIIDWPCDSEGRSHFTENHDGVDIRICDLAAARISERVVGMPYYDILAADAPQQLATIRERMKLYLPVLKSIGYDDESLVVMRGWHGGMFSPERICFFPAIAPLGRPATADDVAAGKAIFHLGGKGKVAADIKLPGVGKIDSAAFAVIVQAEIDEDGKTHFGVVSARDIIHGDDNDIPYEGSLEEYIAALKVRWEKEAAERFK